MTMLSQTSAIGWQLFLEACPELETLAPRSRVWSDPMAMAAIGAPKAMGRDESTTEQSLPWVRSRAGTQPWVRQMRKRGRLAVDHYIVWGEAYVGG